MSLEYSIEFLTEIVSATSAIEYCGILLKLFIMIRATSISHSNLSTKINESSIYNLKSAAEMESEIGEGAFYADSKFYYSKLSLW